MKNSNYYSGLRKLLTIILILLALIPMLLVGWTASKYYQKYEERGTRASLIRIVGNRKELIGLFLANQKDRLSSLVKLYTFEDCCNQENLERLYAAVNESQVIIDLGVIDAMGKHVAYAGPYKAMLSGKDYSQTEWFQEVMANGTHISDIFIGYRNIPHIVVAVADPLRKWVLRATINSEFFNSLLHSAQIDKEGDAFIVNRQGEFQTPSLHGQTKLSDYEETLLVFHEGTVVNSNNDAMYVTSWLKDGDWLLVVKVGVKSSYEFFLEAKNINEIIIFWVTIGVIINVIFIVRFVVNKIESGDQEKASMDSQMLQIEKMASLGRMAAGVAHEVNNPLQLITDQAGWICDLMAEEDPQQLQHYDEYRNSINKIKQHVKRASNVTHRLLAFSRKTKAETTEVNINGLIKETISFLKKEADDNDIAIQLYLSPDLPEVMTDASSVQQVFLNLLNNSIDAIGKRGIIDITSRKDADTINIDFEDSGPGIKPKDMEQIFDPFFTTKQTGKGTGLGLSISYNIIQRLGGRIKVRNSERGGAIFTVSLPMTIMSGN